MKFTYNNNEYELILLSVAGSRLYGNATEDSDYDYRGIFVATKESKLGLISSASELSGRDLCGVLQQHGLDIVDSDDVVLYEVKKFFELAKDNNPNIMDILYTDEEAIVYINEKGEKLLENRYLFLSKKSKFTFSGYAISQLKRIKNHSRWINKYPHVNDVVDFLFGAFKQEKIDFRWIKKYFSSELAEFITGEKVKEHTVLKQEDLYTYKDFKFVVFQYQPEVDLDIYKRPSLEDFVSYRDLRDKKLDPSDVHFNKTLSDLLNNSGSFRKISESTIIMYTDGEGLLDDEGFLKRNPPEEVGEFVCIVQIDHNKFKSKSDDIQKLWHWKVNRNEKRNILETKFGYDTKHASHLVRLMLGVKRILEEETYKPRLDGEDLSFVKSVRSGEYTYEYIIEFAESMDKELDELYKTSSLKKTVNIKSLNKLLLELST